VIVTLELLPIIIIIIITIIIITSIVNNKYTLDLRSGLLCFGFPIKILYLFISPSFDRANGIHKSRNAFLYNYVQLPPS